jgi:hypothetical protein
MNKSTVNKQDSGAELEVMSNNLRNKFFPKTKRKCCCCCFVIFMILSVNSADFGITVNIMMARIQSYDHLICPVVQCTNP